jgi:hypothetical protein
MTTAIRMARAQARAIFIPVVRRQATDFGVH